MKSIKERSLFMNIVWFFMWFVFIAVIMGSMSGR